MLDIEKKREMGLYNACLQIILIFPIDSWYEGKGKLTVTHDKSFLSFYFLLISIK